MNLANMFRDRVSIQERVVTATSMGETVNWNPVEKRYARVIVMDAKARALYQQMQTEATHVITFRGDVSVTLADNRFLWKDKTLEPVDPPKKLEGVTTIAVREI